MALFTAEADMWQYARMTWLLSSLLFEKECTTGTSSQVDGEN